jgi:hypothetical protein
MKAHWRYCKEKRQRKSERERKRGEREGEAGATSTLHLRVYNSPNAHLVSLEAHHIKKGGKGVCTASVGAWARQWKSEWSKGEEERESIDLEN